MQCRCEWTEDPSLIGLGLNSIEACWLSLETSASSIFEVQITTF